MSKTHIVWFKRDLRVHDHAPLAAACSTGDPALALYIFEPELWSGPDGTARQLTFLKESLSELKEALEERGAQLVIRTGEAAEVFANLHRDLGIAAIHMHRESRGGPEGRSNDAVRRWALRAGVSVRTQESASLLKFSGTPGEWQSRWQGFMASPRRLAPEFIFSASARSDEIDDLRLEHLQESDEVPAPPGGRTHAVRLLRRAFVAGDAHTFRDVVRALKQHIMMGTISVREAAQAAMRAQRIGAPGESVTYAESLLGRLRENCEREYRMETRLASRPFGDLPGPSALLPEASRRYMAASATPRRGPVPLPRTDQLSFDFPGSKKPSQRA